MRAVQIKPILKYPGAKWRIADWIVAHFPPHVHYVEPFFGSGAVFFTKPPSKHEVINDLDDRVRLLFRVARSHNEQLARAIELTPYSRMEYYESHEHTGDDLEDARRFLVRCWMAHGFKPSCRTGWRHNGSKSIQPITVLWNDVPARLRAILARLKDAEIEGVPALALIARYATADTLLYVDPPYPLATRNQRKIYRHEMTDADHLLLLDALDAHPGPVVLSGYHCDLYDQRLAHWTTVTLRTTAEKGKRRTEVLWLNAAATPAQRTIWEVL